MPDGGYVVLDPLCALVPAEFVADLVRRTTATGIAHAGARPVTDTVKVLRDGAVGETLDRDTLRQVTGPVAVPQPVAVGSSLAELVAGLAEVVLVEAPALARRITDESDLRLLEALAAALRRA